MDAFLISSRTQGLTLVLGLVSLGLASASPVTAAAMTEEERCAWKADKVEARYARCLTRSATRLSNVLSGITQEEDEHCAEQFSRSMDILERRARFKDVGAECLARISEDGQSAAQAEALVGAGRDLADYPDLGVDDLADSPIGDYLDQSYGAGYADGEASVDITADNQSVCEAADGTWENGTCAPAPPPSSYNCFIGGFCSVAFGAVLPGPPDEPGHANAYYGHTPGTEPALSAGCNIGDEGDQWDAGTSVPSPICQYNHSWQNWICPYSICASN